MIILENTSSHQVTIVGRSGTIYRIPANDKIYVEDEKLKDVWNAALAKDYIILSISGGGGGTDDHALLSNRNIPKQHISEAITYTNNNPTNVEIGNIPIGSTFNEASIWEILDKLTHVNIKPSITSFTISPSMSVYEKGSSVYSLGFNTVFNPGTLPVTELRIKRTTGTDFNIVSNPVSPNNYSFTGINLTQDTTFTVQIKNGTDTVEASKSVYFVDPIFNYCSDLSSPTALDIQTNAQETIARKGSVNLNFSANVNGQYPVIAYPQSYGPLTSIIELDSGMNFDVISGFVLTVINVTTLSGVVSYNVYTQENITDLNSFNLRIVF